MKRISLSWVRNEVDIIEAFVRYHYPIFDKMIIVVNNSNDGTDAILHSLIAEGFNLDLRQNNSFRHCQADVLTKIMQEVADDFDWIVPLDADEFLVFSDLENTLLDNKVNFIRWHNYIATKYDDANELNILKRLEFKSSVVEKNQHKCIIPSNIAKIGFLAHGNHEVYFTDERKKHFPYKITEEVYLAHFPIRSKEQIYRKVVNYWLSKLANPKAWNFRVNKNKLPMRHHWKKMFDLIKTNSDIDLMEMNKIYSNKIEKVVHAPIPFNFDLKYTKNNSLNQLEYLAEIAEIMAINLNKANRIIERLWEI